MQIREANEKDCIAVKNIHLQAFDDSEAALVADVAASLLLEKSAKTISLLAIENDEIIGHVAFSPVYLDGADEHFAYILAPLAVLPGQQNKRVGSALVQHGLDIISSSGAYMVFVYGDPAYYSRFGFKVGLAKGFSPSHRLSYPEGWLALNLGTADFLQGGKIRCVDSLDDPELW